MIIIYFMFGFGMLKAFVVAKGWILLTNFFFFLLFAFKAFGSMQSMPVIQITTQWQRVFIGFIGCHYWGMRNMKIFDNSSIFSEHVKYVQ